MEGINGYPEEYVKPLLLSLRNFENCNVLFFHSNTSVWKKYWRYVYMIPLFILYYLTVSMYVLKLFSDGLGPFEDTDMISMWIISTQELLKYIVMVQNGEEVRAVIENLGSIWRTTGLTEEQSRKKNSALKQLNFGQKSVEKSAKFLAWLYLLLPLAETLMRFIFLAQEAKMVLPYAYVYHFAIDNWPKYLGVYAFQVYSEIFLLYMYLANYLLMVELSTFISIQFILLQEDLIDIKPTNNSTGSNNDDEITEYHNLRGGKIEEFIRRHQEVIWLSQRLNIIFDKIIFLTLLFTTIIICFYAVAFKASKGTAYTVIYFAIIVHFMFTILVMCYCSELLSTSSTGIAHAAAKHLWYKGDLRYQTIIYFIMMRSQKPCTLTYVNYFSISMNTFNKVLKTTYSYFSLASHLYDSRDCE